MIAPALAAQRFAAAWIIGVALGLIYGFLRPLRPKYTAVSDLLFLVFLAWGLILFAFGVCRGEFRFPYLAGVALGGICWETGPGRYFRGIFAGFWKIVGEIWSFLLFPGKIFFKTMKKMFASGEKWVTIGWNNRRHMTRKFGGKPYGRIKRVFRSDQAGADAYAQSGEGDHHSGHLVVYGNAHRAADLRDGSESAD